MSSTRPFFEPDGSLDSDQLLREAIPLAKLIAAVLAIALVPFLFVLAIGGRGGPGLLFVLIAQFVLAVGTAITLMYVIARAIALTADDAETTDRSSDESRAHDGRMEEPDSDADDATDADDANRDD